LPVAGAVHHSVSADPLAQKKAGTSGTAEDRMMVGCHLIESCHCFLRIHGNVLKQGTRLAARSRISLDERWLEVGLITNRFFGIVPGSRKSE